MNQAVEVLGGPVLVFLLLYGLAWMIRNETVGLDTRIERAAFALKGLAGLAVLGLILWGAGEMSALNSN